MKAKKSKSKSRITRTRTSKSTHSPLLKIIFVLLVISAVGYFAYSRLPKAVPIGINEVSNVSQATVTLSLPSTVKATPGSESSIDLTIDTGNAKISAVQVELNYDPALISTPTLSQGDFLTEKLGTPKVKDGVISFVYVIPLGSEGKSGTGKLATLKFKALKDGGTIAFSKNTMVASIGSSTNALKAAIGTTIQTSQSSTPATPPVLKDIVVVPTPNPTNPTTPSKAVSPKSTAKPAANSVSSDTTARRPDTTERVFDETANFGERSVNSVNLLENTTETAADQSAFARFLAWIKLFFGGNNAQN